MIEGKKSEGTSSLCKSFMALQRIHVQKMIALACFEGGVFGPLRSEGHPSDTRTGLVECFVVSADLNWVRTSSKFLKNNLSNCYYSKPYVGGIISK